MNVRCRANCYYVAIHSGVAILYCSKMRKALPIDSLQLTCEWNKLVSRKAALQPPKADL